MKVSQSKLMLLLADLAALVISFRLAYFFRYEAGLFAWEPKTPPFDAYYVAVLLAVGIWMLLFFSMELHEVPVVQDFSISVSQLAMACAFFIVLLLAGSYLAKTYYSRLLLILLSISVGALLATVRFIYQIVLKWLAKQGVGLRRVVIVGQSELARELADRIKERWNLQYELVGFLFPTTHRAQQPPQGGTMGRSDEIAQKLRAMRVEELIFTVPVRRESEILEFIANCQKQGMSVRLVPEYYELHTSQIGSGRIDGIPMLELKENLLEPPDRILKRITDFVLATFLAVLFSLPMLLIAIVLRIASKGRVIKREVRIGLGGRPFVMYRFDVSVAEHPAVSEDRTWGARFCRFLHRYSLSELPQLWNVLKGDMSIVGPRPETPERVRHYSAWHKRRLELKAGITGLAQVKGLRGMDSSDLKTKYDLEYAAKFTPLLDFALVLATFGTLCKRRKRPSPELLPTPQVSRGGTFGRSPSDLYH